MKTTFGDPDVYGTVDLKLNFIINLSKSKLAVGTLLRSQLR